MDARVQVALQRATDACSHAPGRRLHALFALACAWGQRLRLEAEACGTAMLQPSTLVPRALRPRPGLAYPAPGAHPSCPQPSRLGAINASHVQAILECLSELLHLSLRCWQQGASVQECGLIDLHRHADVLLCMRAVQWHRQPRGRMLLAHWLHSATSEESAERAALGKVIEQGDKELDAATGTAQMVVSASLGAQGHGAQRWQRARAVIACACALLRVCWCGLVPSTRHALTPSLVRTNVATLPCGRVPAGPGL